MIDIQEEIERYDSWSKIPSQKKLVARKKVDKAFIDLAGSGIPKAIYNVFSSISKINENLSRVSIKLVYEGRECEGEIVLKKSGRMWIYIRDKEIKAKLKEIFKVSLMLIEQYEKKITTTKKYVVLPDEEAEYVEFYRTDKEDVYEMKFITREDLKDEETNITYWFAGANYDGEDLTQDFIDNSIYAIGWVGHDLKGIIGDLDKMNEMYEDEEVENSGVIAFNNLMKIQKGDKIALKKAYTEGEGHSKSVLEVNAIGEVLGDVRTSYKYSPVYRHTIPVKWTKIDKLKTRGGYWGTLNRCADEDRIEEVFGSREKNATIPLVIERIGLEDKEGIDAIYEYITNQGLTYSIDTIYNFYLSLKSKPFTILAGISGTGKSKLVRLFAEAIGADFTLIPVKPDWSDATELLGYKDLEGEYQVGKFIQIIREARKPENKSKPYIVCLDEMNLARVEYYFSDFLSLIESRDKVDGEIRTDCFNGWGIEKDYIPENVYIVGTVNMDETTFQFSKKVLDRANTIELSEVNLAYDFDMDFDDEVKPMLVHNDALKSEYLLLKDCKEYKELAQRTIEKLIAINEILMPCGLEFAYRVRDEIIFYMVYNEQYQLLSEEDAFDFQLLQKILPRISGTSRQVEDLLIKLLDFCTEEGLKEKVIAEERDELQIRESAIYKKSVKKLLQMLRRCEDGFTSFW